MKVKEGMHSVVGGGSISSVKKCMRKNLIMYMREVLNLPYMYFCIARKSFIIPMNQYRRKSNKLCIKRFLQGKNACQINVN